MTTTTIRTMAASAVLALSILGGGAAVPALAIDPDVDFYCYDMTLPNGQEKLVCETIGDMQADCKLVDPDNLSDECQDVSGSKPRIGQLKLLHPVVVIPVPQSLSGGDLGSGDRGRRTQTLRY